MELNKKQASLQINDLNCVEGVSKRINVSLEPFQKFPKNPLSLRSRLL